MHTILLAITPTTRNSKERVKKVRKQETYKFTKDFPLPLQTTILNLRICMNEIQKYTLLIKTLEAFRTLFHFFIIENSN